MAYTGPIALNGTSGSALLVNINKANRVNQTYQACVMLTLVSGTGTYTLAVSPDGGTTKIPLKDKNGTAISLTASGYANIEIAGYSNNNKVPLQVYAVLASGTAAVGNINVFDNNG